MLFPQFCRPWSLVGATRWGALAAAFSLAVGCSTADYEARMEKSLAKLKQADKFSALERQPTAIGVTPIAQAGVKLRLPAKVSEQVPQALSMRILNENSVNPDSGGGKIDPARLQPPYVDLPGTLVVCEGKGYDGRLQVPFHLHIAVESLDAPATSPAPGVKPADAKPDAAKPAGGDKAADSKAADAKPGDEKPGDEKPAAPKPLKDEILEKLKAAVGKQEIEPSWYEVTCETPTLGEPPITWQCLEAKAEQTFGLNSSQYQKLPGIWKLYLHETPTRRVILVWRVPDQIAEIIGFQEIAERVGGTLQTP